MIQHRVELQMVSSQMKVQYINITKINFHFPLEGAHAKELFWMGKQNKTKHLEAVYKWC